MKMISLVATVWPGRRGTRTLGALACLAALLATPVALAWGPQGHQEVGAIADELIEGTRAGAVVAELLGGMGLQSAAVWADCAKGVSSRNDLDFSYSPSEAIQFPECRPFSSAEDRARFESYVKRNWRQCGSAQPPEMCHHQYHYADVAIQRDHYPAETLGSAHPATGISDHDVVHAVQAAIRVLQGGEAPAPFSIADRKEALLLLAHWVGDLHQPLHVAAVYLDRGGRVVDPDNASKGAVHDTAGGNDLLDGTKALHAEWDDIPPAMAPGGTLDGALRHDALLEPPTLGDIANWPVSWATDTLQSGRHLAFDGLRFAPAIPDFCEVASGGSYGKPAANAKPQKWPACGISPDYRAQADALKRIQLAKAGARLAALLRAIFPDGTAPTQVPINGYLPGAGDPGTRTWLPAAPAPGSAQEVEDVRVYQELRRLFDAASGEGGRNRAQSAADDDVYPPSQAFVDRFVPALGMPLNLTAAPHLVRLMKRASADEDRVLAPLKLPISEGGRVRPFVAHPREPNCFQPQDLTHHADVDLKTFHLAESGSYPSGHAFAGMFFGLLLSQLDPVRATPVMARALEFGESRMVCGFHYHSDVQAGRLAAAWLFARLQSLPEFQADWELAKQEIAGQAHPALP